MAGPERAWGGNAMRWARIGTADGPRYGIFEGDSIATVEGSPFGDHARTSERIVLESAAFLPPVVPPTFYAAGLNYPEHAVAAANKRGEIPSLPESADIGYRAEGRGPPFLRLGGSRPVHAGRPAEMGTGAPSGRAPLEGLTAPPRRHAVFGPARAQHPRALPRVDPRAGLARASEAPCHHR